MKNFLKLLLALALLPTAFFCAAEVLGAFWEVVKDFRTAVELLAGAALYCAVHFCGYHFDRMYVWGHETTHAALAMLFGFRVHSMQVNKDSGYVKMDRTNAAVVLAPYIVPLYAVLTGLVYAGLSLFVQVAPYRPAFVFLVGFFMAFHFVQTVKTLWETQQPDLKLAGGRVFSVVIIILGNAAVLALVLKCLFPDKVLLGQMVSGAAVSSYNTWKIVINYIVEQFISSRA